MAKGYRLDKTGSRCRAVGNGKYAKFALCQVKSVAK